MQYLISTGDVVHHLLPNGSSCPDATIICSRELADKIVSLLNDHARLDKGSAEQQTGEAPLQQLKAEISAIVKRCELAPKSLRHHLILDTDLEKLLKLSAV